MEIPSVMATLTLERSSREFVEKMKAAGMKGVRINSAHVSPETLKEMIQSLHATDPSLTILTDTKGAEVRTTFCSSLLRLRAGDTVEFVYAPGEESSAARICLNAPEIGRHIVAGQRMEIDDGAASLEVTECFGDDFRARVLRDAEVGSRKSVVFPGIEFLHLPSVSDRDRQAIIAAREAGADMIAHSFVRDAADVMAVRELLGDSPVKVFAKVECRAALRNIDGIIDAADGILFARGDLGSAIPLEELPGVQWETLAHCRRRGCPVILSTQILQSMTDHPSPTRAEVNDIFLGVAEGASIFLLCGETAAGNYPAEATSFLTRTIERSARYISSNRFFTDDGYNS